MINYVQLEEFCREIVEIGGSEANLAFNSLQDGLIKPDNSYVSRTDKVIENMLFKHIHNRYPNHSIYSEEYGFDNRKSDFTWYLDPLDGTTNFLYQIPIFGCIACVTYKNRPIAAAMMMPQNDKLFSCSIESGLNINCKPFSLKNKENYLLNEVTIQIETGTSVNAKTRAYSFISKHLSKFRSFRRYGSYASFLLALETNKPFIGFHFQEAQIYEVFALSLLFEKAGYCVLNSNGENWTFMEPNDLVYAPTHLRKELRVLLNS